MTIQDVDVMACLLPSAVCGPEGLLTTEELDASQLRRQSCKGSQRLCKKVQ